MTDSESEVSNSNVFTFQNVNTTVSARGPNTNITNFSFRNPMTSSMYMPRNFERQRYAESVVSDQRSLYYRRETSPMSIQSACDMRPRNFQNYYNRMGSQQSIFNGRSGSPMSMRSIDSSASVSAADIAFAFKNVKFNKYDLKVIKEAYHKLMKQRVRKRIEKRRNMRLFLKGSKHRSGDDSGEQGSDSSISSDDCRSVKTSYNENNFCNRSARIELTDFRKVVKESNMVTDCTEDLRHTNKKNNIYPVSANNFNRSHSINSTLSKQTNSVPTQKDRFKNGFLLPSQRFNKSVASIVIPENSEKQPKNMENNCRQNDRMNSRPGTKPVNNCESGSEEEIFSEMSVRDKEVFNAEPHRKRILDSDDDSSLPAKKKSKISSPTKNAQTKKTTQPKTRNISPIKHNNLSNNFEFAKPTLPVKKSKQKVQEKVIAKSKQPLTGFVELMPSKIVNNTEAAPEAVVEANPVDNQTRVANQLELTQNSDVSMRPSFIKRKLFTQKLDVAEKANLSSSDGINSPQSGYTAIQKEKNKARKLVTTQSCLNREVQEDNNLLDLIHKIVPPDRINITNQTSINQTKTDGNNSNKKDESDKWDVTSVISMCNENDVSDTFTDEDIFENNDKKKNATNNTNIVTNASNKTEKTNIEKQNHVLAKECRIVIEKINNEPNLLKSVINHNINGTSSVSKTTVKNSAKTFWDTDFESDAECQMPAQKKSYIQEQLPKENTAVEPSTQEFNQPIPVARSPVSNTRLPNTSRWLNSTKDNTLMNNTVDSTRKLNASTFSLRSHRTSKKKKCCNEACFQEIKTSKPVIVSKNTSKPENKAKISNKPTINNTTNVEISNRPTSNSEKITKKTSNLEKKDNNKQASNPDKNNKKKSNSKKNNETSNPERTDKNKTCNIPVNSTKDVAIKTSTKKDNLNGTLTKSKTKTNVQNANKSRSTSRTRKSPTTKNPKQSKQVETNLVPNDSSRSRTPKRNQNTENSRVSLQFNISPLTVRPHRAAKKMQCLTENTSINETTSTLDIVIKNPKAKSKQSSKAPKQTLDESNTNSKEVPNIKKCSIKSKGKSQSDLKTEKNVANISVSSLRTRKSPLKNKSKAIKQISKNISNFESPRIGRPIRTCRTPSQNRSIGNYKSSLKGR